MMAEHEYTSDAIAIIASKGLSDPGSLTLSEIMRVCASALTQVKDKKKDTEEN